MGGGNRPKPLWVGVPGIKTKNKPTTIFIEGTNMKTRSHPVKLISCKRLIVLKIVALKISSKGEWKRIERIMSWVSVSVEENHL